MTKKPIFIQRGFARNTAELPDEWFPLRKKGSPRQRPGRIKITSLMAANPRARRRTGNKLRWRGKLPDGAIWEIQDGISRPRRLRILDWNWRADNKSGFDGGAEAGGGGGGGGGDGCGCGGCGCGGEGCGCEGCGCDSGCGNSADSAAAADAAAAGADTGADTGCAVGGCAGCFGGADTGDTGADTGCAVGGCAGCFGGADTGDTGADTGCAVGGCAGCFGGADTGADTGCAVGGCAGCFGGDFGGDFGDLGGQEAGHEADIGLGLDFGAPIDAFGSIASSAMAEDLGLASIAGPADYGLAENAVGFTSAPGLQSYAAPEEVGPQATPAEEEIGPVGPQATPAQAAAMYGTPTNPAAALAPTEQASLLADLIAANPTASALAAMGQLTAAAQATGLSPGLAGFGLAQQGFESPQSPVGMPFQVVPERQAFDQEQQIPGVDIGQAAPGTSEVAQEFTGEAAPGTSDFAAAPTDFGPSTDFAADFPAAAAPTEQTAAADFPTSMGGGDLTGSLLSGDMWGGAPAFDSGQQFATFDTGTMTDLGGGAVYAGSQFTPGSPDNSIILGPGSQFAMASEGAAPGEIGAAKAEAEQAETPSEKAVVSEDTMPEARGAAAPSDRGDEETTATPAGGEPSVEGGASQEPVVSENVAPEVTAQAQERAQAEQTSPTEPVSQALGVPDVGGKDIIQQTQAFSEEPFGAPAQTPTAAPAAAPEQPPSGMDLEFNPFTQSAAAAPAIPAAPAASGMDLAGDQGLAALGGAWAAPALSGMDLAGDRPLSELGGAWEGVPALPEDTDVSDLPEDMPTDPLVGPETEKTWGDYIRQVLGIESAEARGGSRAGEVARSENKFVNETGGPINFDNPMLTVYSPGQGGREGADKNAFGGPLVPIQDVLDGKADHMNVAGPAATMGQTGTIYLPDGQVLPFIQTDRLASNTAGHVDVPMRGGSDKDRAELQDLLRTGQVVFDQQTKDERIQALTDEIGRPLTASEERKAGLERGDIDQIAAAGPELTPAERTMAESRSTIASQTNEDGTRINSVTGQIESPELTSARDFLVSTITAPGATMTAQGVIAAVDRLAPDMVVALGGFIVTANQALLAAGKDPLGISSAYRATEFGLPYGEKSIHGTGYAADLSGIPTRSNPSEGREVRSIVEPVAADFGLYFPYSRSNAAELNHIQLQGVPLSAGATEAGRNPYQTLSGQDLVDRWAAVQSITPGLIGPGTPTGPTGLPWAVGGSQVHQGDQADLAPYATSGTAVPQEPAALPQEGYGGFQAGPIDYGQAIGPEYGGYEPFALSGYPGPGVQNPDALMQSLINAAPQVTSENFDQVMDIYSGMGQPPPGWAGLDMFGGRGPHESFPDVATPGWEIAKQTGGVGAAEGQFDFPIPTGGIPVDPLTGYPVTPVERGTEELPPPMDYVAPPQPTGMIGPDRPPTEPQGPELPSYEQMLESINIPASAGIQPPSEIERAPLGEVTGGVPVLDPSLVEEPPFTTAEPPAPEGEIEIGPERPTTKETEPPERTAMGRSTDKTYEPPARMVVDIEKNIRTLIANTPADKREQSREFWGYMAPRIPEIVAGKISLEQAIREVYPNAGGIIITMINSQAPGGVRGVQDMLLSKSPEVQSVAAQILQAYGTTNWGALLDAQGRPTQGLPPEDIPQTAPIPPGEPPEEIVPVSPPGTFSIAPPENVGDYPPMTTYSGGFPQPYGPQQAYPPGVTETSPGILPSAPATPGAPSLETPAPTAPAVPPTTTTSPTPGGFLSAPDTMPTGFPQSGLAQPPGADLSYFGGGVPTPPELVASANQMARTFPAIAILAASLLTTQPAAVKKIMAKYGVDSQTAAIILAQQEQSAPRQEGGRVDDGIPQYGPQDNGIPEGFVWDATGTKLVPRELARPPVQPTDWPPQPPGTLPQTEYYRTGPLSRVPWDTTAPDPRGFVTLGRDVPGAHYMADLRFNPDAFDRWLAGLPESENIEDLRTPTSDPANISGRRFRAVSAETEAVNREADRIRMERELRERRERAEKHSKKD